jgi:mono/diheme cytochrome c family protein
VRVSKELKLVLVTGLVGLALIPVAVTWFVRSGIYDVAASKRHTKFTEWITHGTMAHSVAKHAKGIAPPARTGAGQLTAGFCSYEAHCVACHGAAAVPREAWVSGLEPQPPYLLDVTQRFTPSELFWIVRNGIKMTAMPAWQDTMSERETWDVVAFLETMPKMNSADYLKLRARVRCAS